MFLPEAILGRRKYLALVPRDAKKKKKDEQLTCALVHDACLCQK